MQTHIRNAHTFVAETIRDTMLADTEECMKQSLLQTLTLSNSKDIILAMTGLTNILQDMVPITILYQTGGKWKKKERIG
jgi:hypothetical protein